ncbi:DNA-binding protein [Roseovarius nanhaiticus]|uniref:DNA-binding protein n=1 Tax=Roseovarius nanhaiticus TaxID=573024 RepID=A0A1N7GE10_9RHOB|nr:HU family DNA-binding protein [Roseovarius nanhaiticus]SEK29439.1 DNA-binding protein [Roseovarius nanhaiticus]SIS10716.1 DNA-binding protein [Roseovarius nanhaiticus]
MASRKSTGNKMKSKGPKPSRASASAPNPPAPLRGKSGLAAIAPKPLIPAQAPLVMDMKNGAQSHAEKPKKVLDADLKPARKNVGKDAALAAVDGGAPLKKQELIAQVVERSDIAKKHAKPVIEAMLEVLGEAIAEGRELNLQPMGKIKRKRLKETAKARVVVANIRQPIAAQISAQGSSVQDGTQSAAPLPGSIQGSTSGLSATAASAQPRHPLKEAVADEAE